ncbi:MAG: spermidine/putrescine ABC transporter substrate-binding protein [Eubacterium sp.]|nr:spermidine/putrescine ABC transporter substrate-binding protein [Eubacterium sp.]
MKEKFHRFFTPLFLMLTLSFGLLAGCGSSGSSGSSSVASGSAAADTGSGSKELNIICWSEYLPQEIVDAFTEETGIKVNITTFNSPDEMLAKVTNSPKGTYDYIIGPENYCPIFSKQGLLQELDKSKIPNSANIDKKYLGRENDPDNTYTYPYMFASAVIAYNSDVIKDDITSYADLLKPEYKDSMVVIEDSRAVCSMAAMAGGFDVNDTSDEALASIEKYLTDLMPNIHAFDGASPKTLLINGECSIGLIYGAEALLAQKEVPSIKVAYPEEGVYLGSDSMMITKDGKNQDNAYQFYNYILDGKVSAQISEIFPYINPNDAAIKELGDDFSNNILTNPPEDVVARACTLIDIGDEASKIVDLWTKIKG